MISMNLITYYSILCLDLLHYEKIDIILCTITPISKSAALVLDFQQD